MNTTRARQVDRGAKEVMEVVKDSHSLTPGRGPRIAERRWKAALLVRSGGGASLVEGRPAHLVFFLVPVYI